MLVGARVTGVQLRRRDIVRQAGRVRPRDLLNGATIDTLARHGKEFAIIATDHRTLSVHLGMSGWLSWIGSDVGGTNGRATLDHVHCVWHVKGPHASGILRFRDPRRFGGLWTFLSPQDWQLGRLHARGPDALTIGPQQLTRNIRNSRRAIKAALLDQSVLAGVGNIYADEALFAAGIHPATRAARLAGDEARVRLLCRHLRSVLRRAIRAGGSTVRSFRGTQGDVGMFALKHNVYGRAGQPCVRCSYPLATAQIAQRTTVYCPHCQRKTRKAFAQA